MGSGKFKLSKKTIMVKLKFAVLGCGFWSKFQIGAWTEVEGAELVAVYNRTRSKAENIAEYFKVQKVYDDPEELFKKEKLDFVDIITDVDTHAVFVEMAVSHGIKKIICQKPMAPDFETAKKMVKICSDAGANLYIHENYRWQAPVRRFKQIIDSGIIGKPLKARVSFLSGFPVFDNQPFLMELDHFILTDMGSHVLDVIRFLFGECERTMVPDKGNKQGNKRRRSGRCNDENEKRHARLYRDCRMHQLLNTIPFLPFIYLLKVKQDLFILVRNSRLGLQQKRELFPKLVKFPSYSWADPDYIVNHESGIHINRNILDDMLGKGKAENTGADNLETVRLIWACYESATTGKTVKTEDFN